MKESNLIYGSFYTEPAANMKYQITGSCVTTICRLFGSDVFIHTGNIVKPETFKAFNVHLSSGLHVKT